MFSLGSLFLPSHAFLLLLLILLLLRRSLLSHLVLLVFSRPHEREKRTSWALLCLSSTLRSFVLFRAPLEGLIAAHTRSSFVSSFCHLPSAIFSFAPLIFRLAASPFLFSSRSPRPATSPPCSSRDSTPTDTTGHNVDHEEGLLSHSPLSLSSLVRARVPSLSNAIFRTSILLFLSSFSRLAADFLRSGAENLSFPVPFPSLSSFAIGFSVCRVLLFIFRVLAP